MKAAAIFTIIGLLILVAMDLASDDEPPRPKPVSGQTAPAPLPTFKVQ